MIIRIFRIAFLCAVVCFASMAATAQSKAKIATGGPEVAGKILKGAGKAAVIVVGSAAKIAWAATKFTVKQVALPVAKAVLVEAAPKISLFVLKNSGLLLKKAFPVIIKLALL